MIRIVLTFGVIAGLITGGMFFINAPEDGKMDGTLLCSLHYRLSFLR